MVRVRKMENATIVVCKNPLPKPRKQSSMKGYYLAVEIKKNLTNKHNKNSL